MKGVLNAHEGDMKCAERRGNAIIPGSKGCDHFGKRANFGGGG